MNLSNTPISQILLVALLLAAPFMVIPQFRASESSDPLKRQWERFRMKLIGLGVMLLALLLALPTMPEEPLGYSLTSIERSQLVQQVHDYHRALVRTTEVVYWLIFIFMFWFIQAIFGFSKAMSSSGSPQPD
jgi:hypothetical protein